MYKRVIKYIDKHNILYNQQFGFQPQHSRSQATLLITDKIQKAIDDGLVSCGIFLDLRKAFDTVNHQILIRKLEHYGIRGIANDWFRSYLHNRQQFVCIGDTTSDYSINSCGVPQGSVLGPLLFLIYINDFKNCSRLLDFHLFADDTNLFASHKNISDLEILINKELVNVNEWLCANKLSLNLEKTNFILFHPPQKKLNYCVKLHINEFYVAHEKCLKYLGILIDYKLSW